MIYDLNEGERIMIRRALVLYGRHFEAQRGLHRRAGDAVNLQFDEDRLGAINNLSEKILKEGRK